MQISTYFDRRRATVVVSITFGFGNATRLQCFPLPRTHTLILTVANINGKRPRPVKSWTKTLWFLVPYSILLRKPSDLRKHYPQPFDHWIICWLIKNKLGRGIVTSEDTFSVSTNFSHCLGYYSRSGALSLHSFRPLARDYLPSQTYQIIGHLCSQWETGHHYYFLCISYYLNIITKNFLKVKFLLYIQRRLNHLLYIYYTKNFLKSQFVVPETGFEPVTSGLWSRCSRQLSYSGI